MFYCIEKARETVCLFLWSFFKIKMIFSIGVINIYPARDASNWNIMSACDTMMNEWKASELLPKRLG